MLEKNEVLYSLSDVSIIPSAVSDIKSRSECYPYTQSIEGKDQYLPLIAAPMASVVGRNYEDVFWKNGISCIIPRTFQLSIRLKLCPEVMCAFGLKEVEENFIERTYNLIGQKLYILIDIANGHMKKEIEVGKKLKELYGKDLVLMGGNIANPETYWEYNEAGFDFLRVGIGKGRSCITSTQTGVHYPMASLLDEIHKSVCERYTRYTPGRTKIVADGGMRSYADIIKALALGADYVMVGGIFAKTKEAVGSTYWEDGHIYRDYYGMSTKRAQAEILGFKNSKEAKEHGENLKTSEGRIERVEVEYSLSGWIENFTDYLRSAMSYTSSRSLDKFKDAKVRVISGSASVEVNNK